MPGVELDGNDVLAIHEAAGEAVQRARAGGGPTLARMPDLSHPAACGRHGRFHLSHARRGRGMEEPLPDPAAAQHGLIDGR